MGVFRRGRLAALGAVAGIALMVGTVPAAAQGGGGGVVVGGGTISPGLGALPAAQSITFSGSLTGAGATTGGPVVVNDTCTFSGSSGNPLGGDNVAFGMGTVSGTCTPVAISATLTYVRVGAAVGIEGSGNFDGVAGEAAGISTWVTWNLS